MDITNKELEKGMKRYIKTLNEFFSHLSEEDEEEIAKPKSPEEEEEEDEQDAEDLEKDYNIFDIDEAPVQLEYYNELTESVATKLGLKYDGPYSSEENTVANLGDKHPLNLDDWNNVYYKIYSESNDNPPLYLEYITDPDALEEFMKENGKHWPNVFIYENKDEDFDQKYTMEAKESGMINWLKKEFDEPPKANESKEEFEVELTGRLIDIYHDALSNVNGGVLYTTSGQRLDLKTLQDQMVKSPNNIVSVVNPNSGINKNRISKSDMTDKNATFYAFKLLKGGTFGFGDFKS